QGQGTVRILRLGRVGVERKIGRGPRVTVPGAAYLLLTHAKFSTEEIHASRPRKRNGGYVMFRYPVKTMEISAALDFVVNSIRLG
ncbi:hypothetical protein K0M31_006626, partial [Melipona bicolor]